MVVSRAIRRRAVITLVLAGCMAPLPLEDRPCPCTDGFVCCEATQRCASEASLCGSVVPPAEAGTCARDDKADCAARCGTVVGRCGDTLTCGGCGDGQRCADARCVCDSKSCSGCCAGEECVAKPAAGSCGSNGAKCTQCGTNQSCSAGICTSSLVLYSGMTADGVMDETWEWNGEDWFHRTVAGPGGRRLGSLTKSAGGVLLFGGDDGPAFSGSTWEWDGHLWQERTPAQTPEARYGHAASILGGRVIVSGGVGLPSFLDTRESSCCGNAVWEWTAGNWNKLSADAAPDSAPCNGRRWRRMATLGDVVVTVDASGTTCTFDGHAWRHRTEPGPAARDGFDIASLGQKIVLFGGFRGDMIKNEMLSDTWEYDGERWTQRDVVGPSGRSDHRMATFGGKVILFGGARLGEHNVWVPVTGETWEWDGHAWTERRVPGPAPRFHHAMAAR